MAGQSTRQAEGHPRRTGRPAASDRDAALDEAVARHQAGRRLDLQQLATDLGVGRSTLHSWFGTRDELIAEVLTRSAIPLIRSAQEQATGAGGEWLVTFLDHYNRGLAADAGLMAFVRRERTAALRLMTDRDGLVQPRVVGYLAGLMRKAMTEGYRPPLDPDVLCVGLSQLAVGQLFIEGVGGEPDVATLRAMQAAMLGVPEHAWAPEAHATRSTPA